MTFISYSQNAEDVMLWRALQHIPNGYYIDVGANDPEDDSVTKAFYDRGWRGINIEPVEQWYLRLLAQRQNDINLQIAVGAESKFVTVYELRDTGLSTLDEGIAERHERERGYHKQPVRVEQQTLNWVCEQHPLPEIHFLKIDVEGAEQQVLEGLDLRIYRPWIVVIESTVPNTQQQDHHKWEYLLLQQAYQFVYFDGLNRFYIASEHQQLAEQFQTPPNYFDQFITYPHWRAERDQAELQQEFNRQQHAHQQQMAESQARISDLQHAHQQQMAESQARISDLQHAHQQQMAECQARISDLQDKSQRAKDQYLKSLTTYTKLNTRVHELETEKMRLQKQLQVAQKLNSSYEGSLSWYLTKPLRLANKYVKELTVSLNRQIQRKLKTLAYRISLNPVAGSYIRRLLKSHSALYQQSLVLYRWLDQPQVDIEPSVESDFELMQTLSPWAITIYNRLQALSEQGVEHANRD